MLSLKELDVLKRGYGLTKEVGVRLAKGIEIARVSAKGYAAIFESQLKLGLRFKIFRLL